MFIVTEAEAEAIRAALHEQGELSATVELRRRFPGITILQKRGNAPAPSPPGRRRPEHPAR